ncbi:MAG: S8 family serine peptidase [Bacteroidota bacterium]|nr:S8 family serine peptidase [Bacteroidota bacterium]
MSQSNRYIPLVLVLLLCTDRAWAQSLPEVVPHVVVVQFEAGVSVSGKTATTGLQIFDRKATTYGVHTIERMYPFLDHVDPTPKTRRNLLALRRTYYVRYRADVPPDWVSGDLAFAPGIVYAEPVPVNRILGPVRRERIDPNDPRFKEQPELGLMRLPEAWDAVKSSDGVPKVVIAIVDSGSEWRHEDLRANVWTNEDEIPGNGIDDDNNGFIDDVHGVNFHNGDDADNDPTPSPGNPHGTWVAGAASAVTDNNVGIAGAAWNAEMMHINAASADGSSIQYGYQGILYAAMNGANIINASWGGQVTDEQRVRHLDQTLDLATDMGTLVVAAAGNDNSSNDLYRIYPARSRKVLSVGATEKATRRRAGFSHYGRLVNVFAPGENILTTGINNSYGLVDGTSISSPLTAGLAALVKTRFPDMDPDALREHIRLTSENIDTENPGFAGQLGRGLVNALAAVQAPTLPAVRLKRWSWTDQDGDRRIASGDVVTITATVVNYLSDARELTVGLVGAESYLFLDMTEVEVGFLAGGDSIEVEFEIRVARDAPDNQWVRLYTRIQDGAFEDGADQLSFGVNRSLVAVHRGLSAFYTATDGDNWIHKDNWDITRVPTDEDLAKWFGINLDEGFLVGLVMGTNNLRGTLPPELEDLRHLRDLDLFDNEGLTGPIPPELGNLEQLLGLGLGGNSLSGPIPPEFGNLEQLQVLWLPRNALSGPIPPALGNLEQLQVLSLLSNSLSGSIPPALGNLGQLEELDLSGNSFSGSIPPALGNLGKLEVLDLSHNSFSGSIPPELANLKRLKWLWLEQNSLTGPIPPELGNLEQLEWLDLWRNSLTGPIPPELGNLEQLEWLELWDNFLTGPIPPELGNLEQLEVLGLYSNSLSGSLPPELGNLEQLESLDLRDNSFSGSIPTVLGDLEQLGWLDLSDNFLNGPIPPELGNLKRLWELDLSDNSLNGEIPPVLGDLEQLEWLALSSNSLSGSIPPELGNLEHLKWLNLSDNSLSGSIPAEFGKLSRLKQLSVQRNALTGRLPRSLMQLDNLETFEFGGQDLCIPSDEEFQMWLSNIPSHSGPTCEGGRGFVDIRYDQGEAVGDLFDGLPADARMATRFVIDASSSGKQWNRTISRVDQATPIQALSSADRKARIEELLVRKREERIRATGPEEWMGLSESMSQDYRERRGWVFLEGEQQRIRDVWKERVEDIFRDEPESADHSVSIGDLEPAHAGGVADGRFRSSSIETHQGHLKTSSADDQEVRIDRVWLAPFYDNQFSSTTLPTDAPRNITIYIYSDREGMPGDVLFTKEVEDPRAYAEVTNGTLDFFELDLSNEGIGALPDTLHIVYGNAGTDDNLLVMGPVRYTEKNISHVYREGAWRPLWDLTTTGGNSFNETAVPIRARFRIQTSLQFAQTIADQSYMQGQPITPLVLPEATGGVPPISYSLVPALPTGLAFDALTRTVAGTPTEATTAPVTVTYTATDAAGDQVSLQFSVEVHSPVDIEAEVLPSAFALHANYPNPFTGYTRIVFDLPAAARVSVDVLDITGRRVRHVPARMLEAGWDRSIEVSGTGLPSGMYVYRTFVDLPEGATVKSGSFIRIR